MRKKSHICLANYLVNTVDNKVLREHKKAFVVGNVLPDCKISFVTKRHNITETYDLVKGYITKCSERASSLEELKTAYCTKLGEIIHYIADYFTFPHNANYDGSLSEHCVYEKYLKLELKKYVKENNCKHFYQDKKIGSVKELFEFIEKKHNEYLLEKSTVKRDCMYIVAVCTVVVRTIIELITNAVSRFGNVPVMA